MVGQFGLTASLWSQVNPRNKDEFKEVSLEWCVLSCEPHRHPHTHTFPPSVRGLWIGVNRAALLRVQLPWMKGKEGVAGVFSDATANEDILL
jgi:hypothetical protein